MDVQFVASVAPITSDPDASRRFYAAAAELEGSGYRLAHGSRTEPWAQITARLLSPEGLLVAVCHTPAFPTDDQDDGTTAST